MRDYQLLIFDWDGTLADSISRIVESMHRATDAFSLPRCSDDQVRGIIGLALPEAIRVLYPQMHSDADVARLRELYSVHYRALDVEPSPLFYGVEESLAAFREQGYQLAVATGKARPGLQRALAGRGWLDYFDYSRCADETASKPDPLMLHEILEQSGVSAERAIMVGDSTFDLLMAQRAGMDSVAVGYGAQPLEMLRPCKPVLEVDCFTDLAAWLAGQVPKCSVEGGVHGG
ncbi:HAD-IA family hydrolase [Ectopseudomonas mendocina]|uniref:HAD-IA family hydrolase n=1 Tax=Ectopseudomonas mendocina TaxID=300 RepID=A0ABZ2RLJ4_ECTME